MHEQYLHINDSYNYYETKLCTYVRVQQLFLLFFMIIDASFHTYMIRLYFADNCYEICNIYLYMEYWIYTYMM